MFKCGICQRQNEIRPKVKAARDKRLSRITAAIRAQSLRSRSSGCFYAATATWRGNTPEVAGEDAEDSRLDGLEREFSEVRQMKGQRIALSAQLDSIQNPKRLGVSFATNLHTDIIFIVMMILKTSNAVNVSQEEEERKLGTRMQRPGWRQ